MGRAQRKSRSWQVPPLRPAAAAIRVPAVLPMEPTRIAFILNTCGVTGDWVCVNDVLPATTGGPVGFTIPIQVGHTYVWWVHACTAPGTGDCLPANHSVISPFDPQI